MDSFGDAVAVLARLKADEIVAIWQADKGADTPRRRERAAMLREAGLIDEALLSKLISNPAAHLS